MFCKLPPVLIKVLKFSAVYAGTLSHWGKITHWTLGLEFLSRSLFGHFFNLLKACLPLSNSSRLPTGQLEHTHASHHMWHIYGAPTICQTGSRHWVQAEGKTRLLHSWNSHSDRGEKRNQTHRHLLQRKAKHVKGLGSNPSGRTEC